jgi:hypothetical protein
MEDNSKRRECDALLAFLFDGHPNEIDFNEGIEWFSFNHDTLIDILHKIWEKIKVTPKELAQLKQTIFRVLPVETNQLFEDEKSSFILLEALEAQEKWLEERGITDYFLSSILTG